MSELYPTLLRPFLFTLPPEAAHKIANLSFRLAVATPPALQALSRLTRVDSPCLVTRCLGLTFQNPLGLAAGFDKHAEFAPLWPAFGFGFAELGTVTRDAQSGNAKPRLFRLPHDRALVNRMGFNSVGLTAFKGNLGRFRGQVPHPHALYGVNIGKSKRTPLGNAPAEYAELARELAPLADYLAINVSSPNTPGLRELQDRKALEEIADAVTEANVTRKPVLLKIAPDLEWSAIDAILQVAQDKKLSGVIATNTTLSRAGLSPTPHAQESGGLSGAPLKARSTEMIRYIANRTEGRLPIIGVGGIETAADAYEKIRAGAHLLQLYTGFIYGGPFTASRILTGLATYLARDGFQSVGEAVGSLPSL